MERFNILGLLRLEISTEVEYMLMGEGAIISTEIELTQASVGYIYL
jgi:hypothetical protein